MNKQCLPVSFGGCAQTKPLEDFQSDGRGRTKARCKPCHKIWRSKKDRDHAEHGRPLVERKGFKYCKPVDKGGCGELLPVSQFQLKNKLTGRTNNFCNKCYSTWKRLPLEVRLPMLPKSIAAGVICRQKERKLITRVTTDSYFFHMPTTDCEREYCRVGRAI